MNMKYPNPIECLPLLFSRAATAVGILGLLLLFTPARAQGPMMPPMGMPGMGMPGMGMPGMGTPPMGMPGMGMPMGRGMPHHAGRNPMAALNLTDEQMKSMQDAAKAAQAAGLEVMKRIGDEAADLRLLITEATPDAKKIGAVYEKIFDLQRQAIENAITTYNEQISILDPEQLKKWNAMREQVLARFLPAATTKKSK